MTGRQLGSKASLAVMAVLLAAVSGQASAKVTVNYWDKWGGMDADFIKSMVSKFNKSQNRIEVKYTTVDGGAIQEKFLTTTVAGVGPDLVGNWNHRLSFFVNAQVVQPLDAYLKASGIGKSDFIPSFWDMMTYDGKIYGLPFSPSGFGLYTNKGVFAESGLDPESYPKTIEDMIAYGEKCTRKDGSGKYTRVGYDLSDPGWWPYLFPVGWGADLYNDKNDTVNLGQPGMIKAYEFVSASAKRWGSNIHTILKAGGNLSKTAAFFTGKTAMEINGSWMASWAAKMAPNTKFNIVPLPYGQGGKPNWAWLEADIVFLPKGKRSKEAMEFMKFMMQPENQREFMLKRETFSPIRAVNTPEFQRENKNPSIEAFIRLASSASVAYAPKTLAWADLSDIYGNIFWDVWNQKKSAAQALSDAQKLADAAVKKALRKKH